MFERIAWLCCLCGSIVLWGETSPARAEEPASADRPQRELFVPFADLSVLLGGDARRVFMTRSELDELKRRASRVSAQQTAPEFPHALGSRAVILAADYQATVEDQRASLRGELKVEVLDDGVQAVPLAIRGVGIQSAQVDDQPAMLAEGADSAPILLVEGKGMHRLALEMVLPVATAAAQQSLSWQVPVPPATRVRLTASGDVEIKSGAAVVSRRVDANATATHFELLPHSGQMDLALSLNNRQLRAKTTVLARGVLIDEVTEGYERLHATLSMNVLHGASDEFRCVVPAGFEITQVSTPLLSRWSVVDADQIREDDLDSEPAAEDDGTRILRIHLREMTTEPVVLHIRADRATEQLEQWEMPKLRPLSTAGFAAVVGVLLEDRLVSGPLDAQGLIAIDNQVLSNALPPSVLAAEPGMPRVRPLVTYYAPQGDFELRTDFSRREPRLLVTTNLLLTLRQQGLEIDGGFALLPESEKLFSFQFNLPSGWIIDHVRNSDGTELVFQRYATTDGSRVRVELPGGVEPRSTLNIRFHAALTPGDWLTDWDARNLDMPIIEVEPDESVHEKAAVAVRALDDLEVRPSATSGLVALSEADKSKFGLGGVPTSLAWRTAEGTWQATLEVTRVAPRITSRILSFFQLAPEALAAHYEVSYDVQQARAQQLLFSLPEETPAEVAITGLDGVAVKETNSQTAAGRRTWSVQLAEKRGGRIRLAVDFVQPLTDALFRALTLPELRAENVAYQSGLVALEGHPEIDVQITRHGRSVDIGELVDAEYQVGKRLLGVFSVVGADNPTTVDIARRTIHFLPTTIVQRAELITLVGGGGVCQTAARFLLRTKSTALQARLPEGAELWSVMIDGRPALPERRGDQLVISLRAESAERVRDLQIVFQQAIDQPLMRGQLDLLAPELWQSGEGDAPELPVPLADLKWELRLPSGYRVVHSGGSVTLDEHAPDQPAPDEPAPIFGWRAWFRTLARKQAPSLAAGTESQAATDTAPAPVEGAATMAPDSPAEPKLDAPAPEKPLSGLEFDAKQRDAGALAAPAQSPALPGPGGSGPGAPVAPAAASAAPPGGGEAPRGARYDVASSDWAMEGVRPLTIQLAAAGRGKRVTFSSLGVDPHLVATVIDQRRWQWLGLACGLAVLAFGGLKVRSRLRERLRYIGGVVLVALLLPPLTGWFAELRPLVDATLVAAGVLLAMTLAAALGRSTVRLTRRRFWQRPTATLEPGASTALLLLAACNFALQFAQPVQAQEQPLPPGAVGVPTLGSLERLIESLPPAPPVPIPADAIVVPYDPEALERSADSDRLLVPYDTYLKLWTAAHPDAGSTRRLSPAPFAWSSAHYEAVLSDSDDLKLSGKISLHVLTDAAVSVPIAIAGGALESLTVDGEEGKLQLVPSPVPAETQLMLHLSGRGRKELAIELRMKIEKRGGWRAIAGRLPAAPATSLTLRVPAAHTEVRFDGLADRAAVETEQADQEITTALPSHGRVAWQWRAKIAQADVSQGLAVDARSLLDIQEDALQFAWQGEFQFRRGRRVSFTLLVPADYLVERVSGNNIRGWNTLPQDQQQQLTVDLLTAVADRESFTVFLMRRHDQPITAPLSFSAPVVSVPAAMLQQGQLVVRRSGLIDVRTVTATGLRRIDTPADGLPISQQVDAGPLPLKPYQAFQYSQVPYELELTAQPTQSQLQVTGQTLIKLSQFESSIESRLSLDIGQRPLHHLRLSVPDNWTLDPPESTVAYEWHVEPGDDGRQQIDLKFASGLIGQNQLILRGPLTQTLSAATDGTFPTVALPKIEVLDADRQSGDIVVTSDPAFDVRGEQLQGCQTVLLGAASAWLAPEQRELARLMVHYASIDFSGQLRVSLRLPRVSAFAVTNVKLTDRSIEETILIEWSIRSAGIRELSVVLPTSLAQAQVRGPMIRSLTWTPVGAEAESPVRLRVELQEDVMGQYCLIIERDRLLAGGNQAVPVPVIETGQTEHRFVTLENLGPDELLVAERRSLEALDRSQSQWRFLASLLGGKATDAFVVRENGDPPSLAFATRDRAVVQTVGARIGIAQTNMMVDDSGAYRAALELRVENRTEQFLEIELPEGARLWTVNVAGEPVKPMAGSSTEEPTSAAAASVSNQGDSVHAARRVRVPLIKTAAGDLDYPVVVKYGGKLPRPGMLRTTVFPLARTININVELSQVRLHLPTTKRWLNFSGSMGRAATSEELAAGWLSFRTRQLTELTELLGQASEQDFSKARAVNNLKQLGKEVEVLQRESSRKSSESRELQEQLMVNNSAWLDAQQQLLDQSSRQAAEQRVQPTNRMLLNKRLAEQAGSRALNVANEAANNFDGVQTGKLLAGDQVDRAKGQIQFDAAWLAAGQHQKSEVAAAKDAAEEAIDKSRIQGLSPFGGPSIVAGQAQPQMPATQAPAAPGIVADDLKAANATTELKSNAQPANRLGLAVGGLGGGAQSPANGLPSEQSEGRASQYQRYQQRLEQQSQQGQGGTFRSAFPEVKGLSTPADFAGQSYALAESESRRARTNAPAAGGRPTAGSGAEPNAAATPGYLASLDAELPMRGQGFFFTTPGGAVELTAQSISVETLDRLAMIGQIAVAALIVWWLARKLLRTDQTAVPGRGRPVA